MTVNVYKTLVNDQSVQDMPLGRHAVDIPTSELLCYTNIKNRPSWFKRIRFFKRNASKIEPLWNMQKYPCASVSNCWMETDLSLSFSTCLILYIFIILHINLNAHNTSPWTNTDTHTHNTYTIAQTLSHIYIHTQAYIHTNTFCVFMQTSAQSHTDSHTTTNIRSCTYVQLHTQAFTHYACTLTNTIFTNLEKIK